MADTNPVEAWFLEVRKERFAQVSEHGYTTDHDDEHGVDHLTNLLLEYIRLGEDVKAGAMVLALSSWMKRHDYIKDGLL
jgi:hypothetical protein